jgi:hypothetical protein
MKLQKIILCVAIALAAFGASLGLLEIGSYTRTAFAPLKVEVKPLVPLQSPVVYPQRNIPDFPPPAVTPTEESEPAEEEPLDWGATGDFYIAGEKPKAFNDVHWLSVVDREYSEKLGKVVAVKPNGSVGSEDEDKEFKFSWININDKRISFVTQTKKGVSYQFDGKFIEAEELKIKTPDGDEYTVDIILKGRLTKWRDGKKIAEARVKLAESHGC